MAQRTAHADARLPAIAGLFWTLLNTLRFALTLPWTAACICLALLMQAVSARRDVARRMGTRSRDGSLGTFKAGSLQAAMPGRIR